MHMAWVHRHGDAILDGWFEEAERLSKEALELGRQTHGEDVEGVYGIQMFTIRREQGRLGEVAPVVKRMIDEDPGATAWKPGFAVIASDLGYEAPAQRILDEMAEGDFALELDSKYSTTLSYLAEVATRLGDEARCERLYKLLLPYRDLTITAGVTTVCVGAADRYLGLLASALGDWEIAEAHFRDAIALEERMRAGPWLAHTQHELADMLERRSIGSDIEIADLREKVLEAASQFGMKALHDKYRRYLQ
jgi:tetratricopeptide (TPR) repeat protein